MKTINGQTKYIGYDDKVYDVIATLEIKENGLVINDNT